MNTTSPLWKWFVLAIVAGLALLLLLLSVTRHEMHVAQGQEILHDDFAFNVLEHRQQKTIGEVEARGVFHIVKLEVVNHAKRVGYRLDQHRAVLIDEEGGHYPVSVAAQRALDPGWPQHEEIAPGMSFASELAFDVPADMHDLRLQISWGGPLIDILDAVIFGGKDIRLR